MWRFGPVTLAPKRKPWSPEVVSRVRNVLNKALGHEEDKISQIQSVAPKFSKHTLKGFKQDDRLYVKEDQAVKVDVERRKVKQKREDIGKRDFVARINEELVSPVRKSFPMGEQSKNAKLCDDLDDPRIMEIDWDTVPGQWDTLLDIKPKPPKSPRKKT